MIDIHHHLLWDQDDGSTSLETSLEMARIAAADGITHIACTPHANGQYAYIPEEIDAKIEELQRLIDAEGLKLKLGRGCDFHMTYDNIQVAHEEPTRFSLNNGMYLLVEIPDYALPRGLGETFYEMQISGLSPILTHPERNPTLQQEPELVAEWLRGGILVQVTAGSVIGDMGRRAQKMAHELLANRWVHFIATDAHNTSSRPPRMRQAHDVIADKYGSEYAHLLCVSNPLAAFMNNAMPQQLEPINLYEDEVPNRSWWQRLLGRY
ncbi:MAG: exopolysaccharide biosynthesis protein [Edaphobacter sp.]|uniref:tyrosine-protein phosphatase n=1 Tax=Edaphobacter sp. TaxID=1934404 RepID=UPI002399D046|nr:CpsB/CapC family capsule biosynthesis tyrosine phosphatase [Edaphobacter sp.]MDE1175556.1 exopolysaccharide biosynthesis protein [Edaphobacter sp.]